MKFQNLSGFLNNFKMDRQINLILMFQNLFYYYFDHY